LTFQWLIVAAAGLAVLAASVAGARPPHIAPAEVRVFHAVNGLPGWLYRPLWLPMQLGNLIVGTVAGVLAGWWSRDWTVVIGSLLAMWLKLVVERLVRKRMAPYLSVRQRPGTSQTAAVLRGDVPSSGPSFPSGHVILVAAIGCVVAPVMPAWLWWLPALLTVLVMLGRVYVGAHNPLDVTAGLGAGLLVGGVVAVFVR
jgi:membrane-associated phospholipid phosphatase